jgi:CubicO group peptidase (beta-lactamase class C family)
MLGGVCAGFRPLPEGGEAEAEADPSVVPTEVNMDWRRRPIWGEVHDPNAYTMGGVAGHAGLFSTAAGASLSASV